MSFQPSKPRDIIYISSDEETDILVYKPPKSAQRSTSAQLAKRRYEKAVSDQGSPSQKRRSARPPSSSSHGGSTAVKYSKRTNKPDETCITSQVKGLDSIDLVTGRRPTPLPDSTILSLVKARCGRQIPSFRELQRNWSPPSLQIDYMTHKPLTQRNIRTSINAQSNLSTIFTHLGRKEVQSSRLRLGGSSNVIAQCGNIVAIAANANGVMTTTTNVSAANRDGLSVLSLDGANYKMLAIKSPSHVQAREDYDMEQASDEQNLVFESVLDVEFDPARPKRFLSSGNDMKVLAWNLEEIPTNLEETPKELCVTSLPAPSQDPLVTKHFNAQPHHICFSPSRSHWGTEQARTSTVAISDSEGKINIECFTRETIVCSVDKHPGRQVSSLCWGFNRTENVVFGGTEYSDFKGGIAAGSQAGFLVLPNGDRSDGKYTNSQDEVEQLALNPQGDIIASLTKTCDRSNIRCVRCGRRRIVTTHTLSLYSVTNQAGRLTRKKQNPNLIGSVELPAFASSDRIDEAGSVVSLAWSPCGTYIAVSRDDDFIDVFDSRLLVPQPLMRLKHETPNVQRMKRPAVDLQGNASRCCRVSCKFPEHGVTGMRWVEGTGYYGGLGLVSGGSDGCVRLWDIRQVDSNIILAQLETEVASMSIGDVSERECPLIVGDNDGLVQLFATNPYGGTPLC